MWISRQLTFRPKLLHLFAATLLLTATLAAARYRADATRLEPAVTGASRLAAQAPSQGAPIEMERVTLRQTGFEPAQITRPKGPFVLAVDNVSELNQVEVRLLREAGNQLKTLPISKNRVRWRETLDLHPGTYVLVEANHPEWACRVVITPQ